MMFLAHIVEHIDNKTAVCGKKMKKPMKENKRPVCNKCAKVMLDKFYHLSSAVDYRAQFVQGEMDYLRKMANGEV